MVSGTKDSFLPASATGRNHYIYHQLKLVWGLKLPSWEIVLLNKKFIWKQNSKLLKAKGSKRQMLRYGACKWLGFLQGNLVNSNIQGWRLGTWPLITPPAGLPIPWTHPGVSSLSGRKSFPTLMFLSGCLLNPTNSSMEILPMRDSNFSHTKLYFIKGRTA